MPNHSSTTEHGSLLLSLALILFVVSLAAASGVWYQLRHRELPATNVTPTAQPTANTGTVLNPGLTLDETLAGDQATIQTNLVTPLRQHYATKAERLVHIKVKKVDQGSYPATVELTLLTPDDLERSLTFGYDLSPWNPSMLDNNE